MSFRTKKISLLLGDTFSLYLALYFTLVLDTKEFLPLNFAQHLLPFSLLFLFWLIIFYVFGLYDILLLRNKLDFWLRFAQGLGLCLISGIVFFYFLPLFKITPKTNLFIFLAIFAFLFFLWRRVFYKISGSPQFLERTIIIGTSVRHLEIAHKIIQNPQLGFKLVGLIGRRRKKLVKVQEVSISSLPKNFKNFVKQKNIQSIIVPKNLLSNKALSNTLYQSLPLKVSVIDFASFYERVTGKIPLSEIDKIWFLEKNLFWQKRRFYEISKRGFDLIGVFFILSFTLPFWPLIALAIKLQDQGPIFYKQERIGKESKAFWLIKFRSMKKGAEKEKALWAEKEDPRVTKVGKFLRRFHLDELPQTINVLRGDISLVGPRPERPGFVKKLEKEIPYYHLRHLILPGFTGWGQINFRYARSLKDSHEKFQYDLYYIKNRSFLLDMSILLRTFQLFFKRE